MNYDNWKQQTPETSNESFDSEDAKSRAEDMVASAEYRLKLVEDLGTSQKAIIFQRQILNRCLDIETKVCKYWDNL